MKRYIRWLMALIMPLCLLACGSSSPSEPAQAETAEIADVVNKTLTDALTTLEQQGFVNIEAEKNDESWDENRLIVVEQNYPAGTEVKLSDTVRLVCRRQFIMDFSIKSDNNLLLSKYDIDIWLDGSLLDTVSNGQTVNMTVKTVEGDHTLYVQKPKDERMSASYDFSIDGDAEFSCGLMHDSKGVVIKDVSLNVHSVEIAAVRTIANTEEPTAEPVITPQPEKTIEPSEEPEKTPEMTEEPSPAPETSAEPEETAEPEKEQAEVPEQSLEPEETAEAADQPAEPEETIETAEEPEAEPEPAEEAESTPEPIEEPVHVQTLSTDYKDTSSFSSIEAGTYTFKIPSSWKENDKKKIYPRDDDQNTYVFYKISKDTGYKEDDVLKFITDLTEKNTDISEVLTSEKLFISRIKMGHTEYRQNKNGRESDVTIYAFADSTTGKMIQIGLMQDAESELDFSDDFDRIVHSVEKKEEEVITRLPDDIHFTFKTDVLEYSKKDLDLLTLISCDNPDVKISTNDKIDLLKLGEHKVVYTAVLGTAEKSIVHTFTVKDTKAPKIKIESEKVTKKYGKTYKPFKNIVSVKDPVDGALEQVDEEPDSPRNGWYYVEGKKSIKKSGTYDYTVYACDKHGNRSQKSFQYVIKAKPKSAPKYDYIANKNTRKFHYPDCRDVRRMKEKNKVYFNNTTRDKVISYGYQPCQHCNP